MMKHFARDLGDLFLGHAPRWYKATVVALLALNVPFFFLFGPIWTGWLFLFEFIGFLGAALYAYPLFPGGLLAIEAIVLGMTDVSRVMHEVKANIDVLLLVAFMVPAIFFVKPLLMWIFMHLFARVKDKVTLSLMFIIAGAALSAWLDALTVMAVMMAVSSSIVELMHKMPAHSKESEERTNAFMRSLLMHGAIGTALGGVSTMVGEPQNLMIAHYAGWGFREFFVRMAHMSGPLFAAGLVLCWLLEKAQCRIFGFGSTLSAEAQAYLQQQTFHVQDQDEMSQASLTVMGIACAGLVLALGLQLAPVGLIGLAMLILVPAFTGRANEHTLGGAFKDVMPFAALLVVFFAIVAMIDQTGMFHGLSQIVWQTKGKAQEYAFFTASGILSAVSDNVFVASIYIHEAMNGLAKGVIDKVQFDKLAIAINAGTNIFSIATPNGQAAFLFLLTSAIARRIGLTYLRMLVMALPYTVVLVTVAYLCMGR
jgi:NhaB family Na+:H+ antiporter